MSVSKHILFISHIFISEHMKTTSSVEYTYLGYLHHQVFNELKSWPGAKKQSSTSVSQNIGLVLHAFSEKMQLCTKKLVYLGALWAHPEFEICKEAAELALTDPSFTSGTSTLTVTCIKRH